MTFRGTDLTLCFPIALPPRRAGDRILHIDNLGVFDYKALVEIVFERYPYFKRELVQLERDFGPRRFILAFQNTFDLPLRIGTVDYFRQWSFSTYKERTKFLLKLKESFSGIAIATDPFPLLYNDA